MDENDFDFYDLEEATSVAFVNLVSSNLRAKSSQLFTEVIKSEIQETEMYPCSTCSANFDNENDVLQHVKFVHKSEDNSVSCALCGEKFDINKRLKQHMKRKHAPKQKKLVETSKVSKVVNIEHPDKLVETDIKKEVYDDGKETKYESPLCTNCGKYFASYQKLLAHVATVHSEIEAKCPLCGNVFKHKSYLKAHIRYVHVSTDMNNFRNWLLCDICCKTFKNPNSLYNHKKHVHEYEPGLSCSICTSSAKNSYALRKHEKKCRRKDPSKIKKPKDNLEFPCSKCTSQFSNYKHLNDHHKYAHEILPTQCQLCYRRFKNVIHVRQHLRRSHSQEATHDFYIILNKDASSDEFHPKIEVDIFKQDPMLLLYKMQAQRFSQQDSSGVPDDDKSKGIVAKEETEINCKPGEKISHHDTEPLSDCGLIDDEKMLSEELNGIDRIMETIEHSEDEELLMDIGYSVDEKVPDGKSLLEKYSNIFEEKGVN